MSESTVLSTDELIQLLREGKVEEFNKARPESRKEFSDRKDRKAEKVFNKDVPFTDFIEYVDSEASLRDRLEFCGVNLAGLDLSGANLAGIDFSEANLSGSNLSGANLTNCDFTLANLSRAILNQADVWGAGFHEANVSGVDFSEVVSLGSARFAEAWGLNDEQQQIICAALRSTWTNKHFAWGNMG